MTISSPEDLANESLRAIGFRGAAIGDLYEGSPQARAALELYSQTRDEVLEDGEWNFATTSLPLTLLKGPPPVGGFNPLTPWGSIYAPPGWYFEYLYPADMIELQAIVPPPSAYPVWDPTPATWRTYDDPKPNVVAGVATGPEAKAILCNQAGAVAIYVRRVTDLLMWEPGALATFIAVLAKKLAADPRLAASADYVKMLPQEALATGEMAKRHPG